jgi:hypothetical protein
LNHKISGKPTPVSFHCLIQNLDRNFVKLSEVLTLRPFENSQNVKMSFPVCLLCRPQPSLGRNAMDLETAVQGCGYAVEHGQRVALIIRVFKPADNGGRGTNQFSQPPLAEPSLSSESRDFTRDMIVGPSPFQGSQSPRFTSVIPAVENLHGVGGRFSLLSLHD